MTPNQIFGVVDFFSGCGGTSQGLRDAGFRILAGIDNDAEAANTYRMNFPEAKVFQQNVESLKFESIAEVLPESAIILFAGCAPCQPFSAQNRGKSGGDPRGRLLLEFLRHVLAHRPHMVLVENVPGIQNVQKERGPFREFVTRIEEVGYRVSYDVLRSGDYGVPQTRKRLVLVASRISTVEMPNPTHGPGLLPRSTVEDWISGLAPISAGEQDPDDPEHAAMKLSELNMVRIRSTPEGGGRLDWPEELTLNCHSGFDGHTDVYGRLSWDKPAAGLTTRCVSLSNGRFGHPSQDRAISVREAALLQTFPMSFRFSGSLTSKARQIGNAVPPLVARRTGEALLKSIERLVAN